MKKLHPCYRDENTAMVEPSDEFDIYLYGAYNWNGLYITQNQYNKLREWLEMKEFPNNKLVRAMDRRSLIREAKLHGMRLMAFLARRNLLEQGEDPVRSLATLLSDYLEEPYDIKDE